MSGKYFLDTNIFVYTFDDRYPKKLDISRRLVETALRDGSGLISFQVIQEFINVSTRKFASPLSPEESALYLEHVLAPLCEVHSSIGLYRAALDIHERWQLSTYDALIVASALECDCTILYSENFQDGMKIRDLTVRSPFN